MSLITIQTADAEITVHSRSPQLATLESFAAPLETASQRYTKVLADGTHLAASDSRTDHVAVIDNTTGLMWSVESLGDHQEADTGINQDACKARCSELRLLGFSDWRLPTRTELAGLVDDCQHEPAIDTDAFPRVKSRWHWTSTPAAWSSASAWFVSFSYGYVNDYYGYRYSGGFALAVRRAGQ
ncbi:DUF1566 domain-containing protein [Xanthomonas citri pv. glycines]|uniref:Lcl C-terminal domain-containing protein n=1 Tax=Xanthomonas campestris pv. glycines TaxID=473421 RepID=A0AAX0I4Z4_XANCG|nr:MULTISPECIES: DUF1566 domain-containing protein [Xanthomonas]AOY63429.1 DUF1566 domain-containing protein [Xanthomonas citri pv. glycines str. 8ra]EWC53141.1 hypothetical protein XAR_0581 [Xanthomonas citri pv. glycines str. 8ra]OEY98620.1 hypothetical protein BIY41_09635 [Xanthomonas citri pv. glycines]OOW99948.1 hypothetical protein Xgly_02925 [Xanthomonas citri pv. glycines]QDR44922.1 DUF1566 domain-containing protein [Xanthomonas citri pv. glycines]